MAIKNHWGITVDSEVPVTGVINTTSAELNDDIVQGVDLDFEEHLKECKNEYHDDCYFNDSPTILIGYKKNPDTGLFEIDEDAEYSAIIGEIYSQITHSKYVSRCALCSPCYPGQGDLDTPGEFLTYTLPPEVFGKLEHPEIIELGSEKK